MEENFKISVVVTAYNEEKYIGECIESILRQDYANFEIVVVNDGSKDKTKEIIEGFARNNPKVKAIHKENGGVTAARKSGYEITTGDYVCFVDGDDTLSENYISAFAKSLSSNPDIVLAATGLPIDSLDKYVSVMLQNNYPWGLCKKVFARKVLDNVFTTPREIPIGEDLITNLLISNNSKTIIQLVNDGYLVRFHPESTTQIRKWSLEYETLFISYVEGALGNKVKSFQSELRQLRLNSWKNLVANNVNVPSNHPIPLYVKSNLRQGRISASEIVLRYVPFHPIKRYLLRKLRIIAKRVIS